MKLIRLITHTELADMSTKLIVLTECALGTRAAYAKDWGFSHKDSRNLMQVMAEVAADQGTKLTQREAEAHFGPIENYRR